MKIMRGKTERLSRAVFPLILKTETVVSEMPPEYYGKMQENLGVIFKKAYRTTMK
jgi:hypothetical protein